MEGGGLNRNTNKNSNSPQSPKMAFPPCFSQGGAFKWRDLFLFRDDVVYVCAAVCLFLELVFFWTLVCFSSSSSRATSPRCSPIPLFQTAAEVASLLCVNSPLIQERFYAVKQTCDKKGGGGNTLSSFPNFKQFNHWKNVTFVPPCLNVQDTCF